ncbi:FAD-dependent monooxygenase [Streptacidiphilus neutrinimicus]|uniref:FAD-dependent monooxygenase n=1 Tax=Streptacidiphilus neutrinimicus TaxID=105420 RepID=UPI000A99D929|nr:FAD-dependent monooxygenase [Streptacidiphilus neutrinimicus]
MSRTTGTPDVLVVGAGPTGLALALSAHHHGAGVRVVERRPQAFRPSRALITHARTLEVLRPLGVTDALLARADTAPAAALHLGNHVVEERLAELALPDTSFPHLTLVRQADVEAVFGTALEERGIRIERGTELLGVTDGADRAVAELRTPLGLEQLGCRFVAGCDGPASTVRAFTGIGWRGGPYPEEVVLADLEFDDDRATGTHVVAGRQGLVFLFPLGESATWRMLATRPAPDVPAPAFGQPGPPVERAELERLLRDAGFDDPIGEVAWSERVPLQHRLAPMFRSGRLFLAGDAAHAYSPATGQGMNAGIQDAANLGWKLAFAATSGTPPAGLRPLLDSYSAERRPVALGRLLLTHAAFWGEASTAPLPSWLRGTVAPLAAPAAPLLLHRRRLVAQGIRTISQLRVHYRGSALSVEASPRPAGWRAGDRLPDLPVAVFGRVSRLHTQLATPGVHMLLRPQAAPPVLPPLGPHVTVHRLEGLPGEGLTLVRPDGYIGLRCAEADMTALRDWLRRTATLPEQGRAQAVWDSEPGPNGPSGAASDA